MNEVHEVRCSHKTTTLEGLTSDVTTCVVCGAQIDTYHPKDWWLPALHDEAVKLVSLLGTAVGLAKLSKPLAGQLIESAEACVERVIGMMTGEEEG